MQTPTYHHRRQGGKSNLPQLPVSFFLLFCGRRQLLISVLLWVCVVRTLNMTGTLFTRFRPTRCAVDQRQYVVQRISKHPSSATEALSSLDSPETSAPQPVVCVFSAKEEEVVPKHHLSWETRPLLSGKGPAGLPLFAGEEEMNMGALVTPITYSHGGHFEQH